MGPAAGMRPGAPGGQQPYSNMGPGGRPMSAPTGGARPAAPHHAASMFGGLAASGTNRRQAAWTPASGLAANRTAFLFLSSSLLFSFFEPKTTRDSPYIIHDNIW